MGRRRVRGGEKNSDRVGEAQKETQNTQKTEKGYKWGRRAQNEIGNIEGNRRSWRKVESHKTM